ncbi:MAG: HAD-IB family phosphatase [Nitrospira sp.]|nr:HAD-IB family phosphatase [Nitrospira sp.]
MFLIAGLITNHLARNTTNPRHPDATISEVLCDFDGTITVIDATDAILEAFALPDWREWELRWVRGEISSQECLAHQVELIRADRETLVRFAADLPIDKGIFALDRQCTAHHIPLHIVSDGLDLLIEAVLRRHNLLHIPVFSNHLQWKTPSVPSLSFPFSLPECRSGSGTCKCALTLVANCDSSQIIYIGDGQSDQCVSRKVGTLFAKGSLKGWCDQEGINHHPFDTLTNVTEQLFSKEAVSP